MTLPPLPECYSRFKHEAGMPLYTAAQMTAYATAAVLAEREACAKLCESRFVGDDKDKDDECRACAYDIRKRSAV